MVVLSGELCDSVGKRDAEKRASSVVVDCGGVRVVSVGGEDVGRGHDILKHDADGVCV